MSKLIGSPIDHKNIGLLKLLHGLRDDIDIYYVIADYADTINQCGVGKIFFGHIQHRALESIILSICKIYERENKKKGKYSLNSIDGVFRHLHEESPKALDNLKIKGFIQKYGGSSDFGSPISEVNSTIKGFRKRYKPQLDCFETFRNKRVAHSEYDFTKDKLPSEDVMKKLFLFAADFYELVSGSFVGVGPFDLMAGRRVKASLKGLFQKLGFEDIKTDK